MGHPLLMVSRINHKSCCDEQKEMALNLCLLAEGDRRLAVMNNIMASQVSRGLEARYVWDTALSTIIQVAGFADTSVVGQAEPSLHYRKLKPEPSLADIDLDQPLDSVVLSKLGESYYERYKFLLPAAVDPCDTQVSRLAREIETRALRDDWDTRTQEFQRKQLDKRVKVSPSGDTFVGSCPQKTREEVVERTTAKYWFKHLTLMVAYAAAASMPIAPPPGSLPSRSPGTKPRRLGETFWKSGDSAYPQPLPHHVCNGLSVFSNLTWVTNGRTGAWTPQDGVVMASQRREWRRVNSCYRQFP